ncbi:hypothetical protein [Terrisporobacter vanillatitrophus]|uniref:hypothetical protein n=1 Tax=Terrisporobacter vanillatitrophus TaxID=3058402 RepID=UPI00336932C3
MLEKFTLMCKDVEVGIIEYDTKKEKFSFTLNENIDNIKYLPPILYDYTNLSLNYKPEHENVLWWVEDRVMPPDRDAVDHILDLMGIPCYDAWEICKANKGMSLEDYWWLRESDEKYEECHIRYLIESGKQTYFGRPV